MSVLSFKKVNFNIPSGLDNLLVNINKMNLHLVCFFITVLKSISTGVERHIYCYFA